MDKTDSQDAQASLPKSLDDKLKQILTKETYTLEKGARIHIPTDEAIAQIHQVVKEHLEAGGEL